MDRKRPDGVTLVSWSRGRPLSWDVTVPDTSAMSQPHELSNPSKCKGGHSGKQQSDEMCTPGDHSGDFKYSSGDWRIVEHKVVEFG